MEQNPENVATIVLGAITLHNILRSRSASYGQKYLSKNANDKRKYQLTSGVPQSGNRETQAAKAQRDVLRDYFNDVGKLPYQDRMIWWVHYMFFTQIKQRMHACIASKK